MNHLKIRAVIMRPEHTNDVFIIKPKMMVNDKMFKRGNANYMLNDDHFQITWDKPWFMLWLFKRFFTTYYYTLNKPQPLPVPNFEANTANPDLVDGEQLAAIFEPWMWRVIAGPIRDTWDQMVFYIQVATAVGVAYLVWIQLQGPPTGA